MESIASSQKEYSTEERLVIYRDINDEEKIYNTGINRAKKAGIEQGIEQGIGQGIKLKEKEVIINMINNNFDYEFISKIVNVPVKEIKKLVSIKNKK